ncbi:GGDEF domain-containing response regulator [Undibacterium sp. Ji67W]|uniref:GGDEF domain-containing response regulator n=1 Tax=Undibacterium sp. Ji67W TaxID=3413042 RepID=UPI003BEFC7D1
MDDKFLIFAPEILLENVENVQPPWKILLVDDDDQIHAVTRLNLKQFQFRGRSVQIISAMSGAEARKLLQTEQGIALAFIDVVMESEHSGLHLIRHIREELGNRSIRLILRTGQPGQAPEHSVVVEYEIDDYKAKTELTTDKLFTAVVSSLRSYEYVIALETLNAELESRVKARTEELEKIAMIDPLTGAGNRRHLQARGEAEISYSNRENLPLSILIFDIDHFKQVNDLHGHAIGDLVLQKVVDLAKSALRPSDFLARIGGEEFVVLLPGSTIEEAFLAAERLRSIIASATLQFSEVKMQVTASFGISLRIADESNLDPAIARADEALYRSKHNGRNKVTVHDARTALTN